MLLQTEQSNSGSPCHRSSSILDSPTLARVERAQLRLEAGNVRIDSLERGILDPKSALLSGRLPVETMTGPIKRGVLLQQRDRLFSRWKERYFILTQDYLQCYKKASGPANERISDMGQFMFQIKLVDVEKVEWINCRSYSKIRMQVKHEGAFLFRCDVGLEDWFEYLEECTIASKERRIVLKIMQKPRTRASLASPMSYGSLHPHYLFDSVPNLNDANDENHNGISTNHSTPQKIPYSQNLLLSRYSHSCVNRASSFSTDVFATPQKRFTHNNLPNNNIFDEEEDNRDEDDVELRRPHVLRTNGNDDDTDWMYRKPLAPTPDNRHSVQTTDLDYSSNSTGLSTPPSTYYRPSSYRDVSSSRGTSIAGSFRDRPLRQLANLNSLNYKGSRYSEANCNLKVHNNTNIN